MRCAHSLPSLPGIGAHEQWRTRAHRISLLHVLTAPPGSYGGLPILSSSPESPSPGSVSDDALPKIKGKSRLANCESSSSTTRSRRRTGDASRSSTTLGVASGGHEESRFEARFNASALDPSAAGAPLLDSSTSSTTVLDNDETDDDDDTGLHDMKGNPSDNSPYAQVRASVAATDNLSLSIDTPRMWFLSILFSIAGSSTNLFFSLRYPSVSLTPIIALLLVHPMGLFWDQIFKRPGDPDETFVDGCVQTTSPHSQPKATWMRRTRLWLAQGRWNEKEHCCVYVSSNVSFGFAFATDVCDLASFSNASELTTTGHCRTGQVLPSGPRHHVPSIAHSLHPDTGLLTRRYHQALSRPP